MARGRPAHDIEITPEIREIINAAKRAEVSLVKAQQRVTNAAHRRLEAVQALTEYGMTRRQIAELLGSTPGAIYALLNRHKEDTDT